MASAALTAGARINEWGRQVRAALNHLITLPDIIGLALAAGLMLTPAYALSAAGWEVDLSVLVPIILLGVIFSFLLARSQYGELLCLLISVVYGASFTLLITAANQETNFGQSILELVLRVSRWLVDAFTGGINQDPLVFTVLLSSLLWFLCFNVVWHMFRLDRVWRAAMPPGIILLTNHLYYTGAENLDRYLAVFFCLVLLLLVRSALDAREWEWYVSQMSAPRRVRAQYLLLGFAMAALLAGAAWLVPQRDIETRLQSFQEFMNGDALVDLADLWNRLFTSVNSLSGASSSDYYGSDTMTLGGAIRLGDQVVMLVEAPPDRRYYWKSRSFDFYDSGGWSSAPDTRLTDSQAPLLVEHETYLPGARVAVDQAFTLALGGSQIVYTAPQVLSVDLTTRTDLRFTPDENAAEENMLISVIRPLRLLQRNERYTATSLMSNATPDQLRAASDAYPQWVRDLYNGYMPTVTGRTIALGNQIVREAGAVTAYDKAAAIETWLRRNMTYNETIPGPPPGEDPVDWFLFTKREGYCNYYASSMVVMLRSMGIPARMAAGFAQGAYDPDRDAYVVLEKNAHTWVEVYFPGYGWVEFEPTSAQAPLGRSVSPNRPAEGNGSQPTSIPTSTPLPTLTPTPLPSPTPTATLTPEPQGAQAQPTPNVGPSLPTATPFPTLTPSPFLLPTSPPVLPPTPPDPRNNPFGALLPAIIALVLVLLLIALILMALLLLYWWYELRGMGGLSYAARAYTRLGRYAEMLGIAPDVTNTPEEKRARIVRVVPRAEAPVTWITRLYARERYGGRRIAKAQTRESTDGAWSAARSSMLARALRLFFSPGRRAGR